MNASGEGLPPAAPPRTSGTGAGQGQLRFAAAVGSAPTALRHRRQACKLGRARHVMQACCRPGAGTVETRSPTRPQLLSLGPPVNEEQQGPGLLKVPPVAELGDPLDDHL